MQTFLDGGAKIDRTKEVVIIRGLPTSRSYRDSPRDAIQFAAALNRQRRPIHLIKQDLDKDWAERVKKRDDYTCALCGVRGPKGKDTIGAHHWYKTKSKAGMGRYAEMCGVAVHYAEHIHILHENPCWVDLSKIADHVFASYTQAEILAAKTLCNVPISEQAVRELWYERIGSLLTTQLLELAF